MKKLIAFGKYLMSDQRRELFKSHPRSSALPPLKERLANVHQSDIDNFELKWNELKQK